MIRRWLAQRKLARLIERNRNSYELQDYLKRRKAALKGRG